MKTKKKKKTTQYCLAMTKITQTQTKQKRMKNKTKKKYHLATMKIIQKKIQKRKTTNHLAMT